MFATINLKESTKLKDDNSPIQYYPELQDVFMMIHKDHFSPKQKQPQSNEVVFKLNIYYTPISVTRDRFVYSGLLTPTRG